MIEPAQARAALARHLEAIYSDTVREARGATAISGLADQAELAGHYELADALEAIAAELGAGNRPTVLVGGRQWAADERHQIQQFSGVSEAIGVWTQAEARAGLEAVELGPQGRLP